MVTERVSQSPRDSVGMGAWRPSNQITSLDGRNQNSFTGFLNMVQTSSNLILNTNNRNCDEYVILSERVGIMHSSIHWPF